MNSAELRSIIDQHLTAAYACTRVWEAWQVGTMAESDFVQLRETDFAEELVCAIEAAIRLPAQPVDDLAMLVKQLAHALRKAAPAHALPDRAMDYLRRGNLLGSVLRADQLQPSGIELAARWVQKRLDDYDSEHGSTDPETGTREYPGRGAGDEYVGELTEIIEGIRGLAAPQPEPQEQPERR